MLEAKVQLKLSKVNVTNTICGKYETDKLRTPKIAQAFQLELRNRLQVLAEILMV